ncbi:hypothetical protein IGI04_006240 [Brassica rapa subsp. trilocularis]|uniref:RNase H type-1 domain-containing protein n=1 Tax=Brassica rapa subsp. trilocularis TaxID=1813537 RepID=A0ABQ7NG98_BRACM|nr:hypothetical protein IGI04_006240 [Brassica rapa subsp. trilocularis]
MNTRSLTLYGARGVVNAASPLHAVAEGLIWDMQEVLKMGNREVRFEVDCEQLVKLLRKEEDWPSMAAELDEIKAFSTAYLKFSITYIPRSLNILDDCLAKGQRSRVQNPPNDAVPGNDRMQKKVVVAYGEHMLFLQYEDGCVYVTTSSTRVFRRPSSRHVLAAAGTWRSRAVVAAVI